MNKWLIIFLLALHLTLFGTPLSWQQYKQETLSSLVLIGGSCSPEKAEKMMDLIDELHPKICVAIGISAGCCIFSIARALKYQGQGKVFVIDPWVSEDNSLPDFKLMLHGFQLFELSKIVRMHSTEAAHLFDPGSIDILHIDKNSREALEDVKMYVPKVTPGGYICLNNAHWKSLQPALQYLSEHCTLDPIRSTTKCFLYEKN